MENFTIVSDGDNLVIKNKKGEVILTLTQDGEIKATGYLQVSKYRQDDDR